MIGTAKRLISCIISCSLACVLTFYATAPALAYSESNGNSYGSVGDAVSVFKERLDENPGALSIQSVFSFLAGFNRDIVGFFIAQFMSNSEIDAATESVLSTVFVYISLDEQVNREVITVTVPIADNGNDAKLLNIKVLRRVCAELYKRQFECVSEDRPDLEITPYEHYVGELALHVIAYSVLKNMGGYDSLFPDYFFKTSMAELNVSEPRFTELIAFLSKVLA